MEAIHKCNLIGWQRNHCLDIDAGCMFYFITNLPTFHLSHHTIHIHIKQPWRHHTALS